MITETTHVQEMTLQAYVLGVFDLLYEGGNMSRDQIFNLIEEWAKEFTKREEEHQWEPNWLYYDEVDIFLEEKRDAIRRSLGLAEIEE